MTMSGMFTRAEERHELIPAKKSGGISGDDGRDAHELAQDPQTPAANDLKENQNEGEGNENRLPERRPGDFGLRIWDYGKENSAC